MNNARHIFRPLEALVALLALLVPQSAWAWGGSGTFSSPYTISTAADLQKFANIVNGSNSEKRNVAACAELTADIALTGTWTAMGSDADGRRYTGTFDGKGHAITGLKLTATSNNQGLFGCINNATIQNFTLAGTVNAAASGVGSVVGRANGASKLYNIVSSVDVTIGAGQVKAHNGGIVGWIEGTTEVAGCTYSGTFDGGASKDCLGGIVGYSVANSKVKISNCYFSGTVKTTANDDSNTYVGGILGYANDEGSNFGGLTGCVYNGTIEAGSNTKCVAMFIGYPRGNTYKNVENNRYIKSINSTTFPSLLRLGNGNDSYFYTHKGNYGVQIIVQVPNAETGVCSYRFVNPTTEHSVLIHAEAYANVGYKFVWWNYAFVTTYKTNVIEVNLDAEDEKLYLYAYCEHANFTISLDVNDSRFGTVSGSGTYGLNEKVKITATPRASCIVFDGWSDDNKDNPRTVTVNRDITLTANFRCTHDFTQKSVTAPCLASPATCTAAATYFYTCAYCGACERNSNHTFSSGDPRSHNFNSTYKRESLPTCTREGREYRECIYFDCDEREYRNIPRTTHYFASSDKAHERCTVCGRTLMHYTATEEFAPTYSEFYDSSDNLLDYWNTFDPETGKGYFEFDGVLDYVGPSALRGCQALTSIVVPQCVTRLGHEAFNVSTNLTSVTLPEGLTTIPYYCFAGCHSLKSINVPNSVKRIERNAFVCCAVLPSINIPESLEVMEDYAFYQCEILSSVVLPERLQTMGMGAFERCWKLADVTFKSVPRIDSDILFRSCPSDKKVNLVLTDNSYVYDAPSPGFPTNLNSASYQRTTDEEWSTVIVPFDFTVGSSDDYELYWITDVTANEVVLTKLYEGFEVPTSTPLIVRMKKGHDLTIAAAPSAAHDVAVTSLGIRAGVSFSGTYTKVNPPSTNSYVLSDGVFKVVAGSAATKLAPFRACLQDINASCGEQLTLKIDELTADDAQTLADLILASNWNEMHLIRYDINGDYYLTIEDLTRLIERLKVGSINSLK